MEYQLYINGEWKDTVTGYVAEDKNPADDSVFARVHFAGGDQGEAKRRSSGASARALLT